MSGRNYELTFILPPALSEDDINTLQTTVQSWITDQQGNIVKTNHWGRRKLAYPINNYKEGYYIFMAFEGEPEGIADVDRRLRLQSEVLRHLIVRLEAE